MKQHQRGFVVLPGIDGRRRREAPVPIAEDQRRRRTWRRSLGQARVFVAGTLIGAALWMSVFAAMADEPGPWGVVSALVLFAVAALGAR